MTTVALDTNLLLLLIVGKATGDVEHRRLRSYTQDDLLVLERRIEGMEPLIATPNAWTEVSNLATYGVSGEWKRAIRRFMAVAIQSSVEVIRASRDVTGDPDFERLGLADCVWLSVLNETITLLTDDLALYSIALSRGFKAENFTHLREF